MYGIFRPEVNVILELDEEALEHLQAAMFNCQEERRLAVDVTKVQEGADEVFTLEYDLESWLLVTDDGEMQLVVALVILE
jgi:hypothetical protein